MSLTGPGVSGLPLFDEPKVVARKIDAVLEVEERENAAFLNRVRHLVAGHFKGQDITTDQVWWVMGRYGIEIPAGKSPKILGTFFRGWSRASMVLDSEGKQRKRPSKRQGANGNDLGVWLIT